MKKFITFFSLALATLYMAVSPTSAHGYVSQPPSRQIRCRDENIPGCGDVKFEPQSVEAPQGAFACNGNGPRFPELNDDSIWEKNFLTVPPHIDSLTFIWTLTAPHRTTTWEYFVLTENNDLLTSFDNHNATPPVIVEHSVPLKSIRGRQTILARWNIGDTINAFYCCVDLLISDTEATATAAGAAATPLPVGITLEVPGSEGMGVVNGSSSVGAGQNVNLPLRNVYALQGSSSFYKI